MNYEKLSGSIRAVIDRRPGDNGAYSDLFSLCREWETEDFSAAHKVNKELLALSADQVVRGGGAKFYEQWRRCLLFEAPHDFDSFMTYIELDRKPEKRFYAPRKHYLRPMVQGFQDVLDGKLRLLTISMPKRAGKSQTGINFVNMISGKFPDRSTLMEGTGDDLVKSFYNGCLEYLTVPNEYLFYDVFPDARLVQTNADTKTANLKSKSRFPTIMCRSIDARQVGLSEATNVLYLDDCVEGREEAKNRQRLDDKWEVISGDIMGRAIEGTPMVFTGTRYSLYDPMLPNMIDHYFKEVCRIKAYERYMDDGVAISPDIDDLYLCMDGLKIICEKCGLELNLKKTRVIPLRDYYRWLKTRFIITPTGKVVRKMNKDSTKIVRHKLRAFRGKLDRGEMTLADIRCSVDSYNGHMKRGHSFKVRQRTNQYFKSLYGFYPDEKGWKSHV